jgi:hypothetical protein
LLNPLTRALTRHIGHGTSRRRARLADASSHCTTHPAQNVCFPHANRVGSRSVCRQIGHSKCSGTASRNERGCGDRDGDSDARNVSLDVSSRMWDMTTRRGRAPDDF